MVISSHTPVGKTILRHLPRAVEDLYAMLVEHGDSVVDAMLDNGFDIGGDVLATRPRGIPADHPRLELLRHRTLTAARDHGTPDWLESEEVVERVRQDWVAMRPLIEWCEQYVGASEKPGRFG